MKHCVLSGNRLFKEAIDYGIKAIISAKNKQSWPTVEFIIKKIKDDKTGIIKYATKQQLDILNLYNKWLHCFKDVGKFFIFYDRDRFELFFCLK